MSTEYTLCALKIGAVVIGQITDQEVSVAVEEFLAADSGAIYSLDAAVNAEDYRIRATTQQVKTALGIFGAGMTVIELTAQAPAILYFHQFANKGTRTAAACIAYKVELGFAVVQSVRGKAGPPPLNLADMDIEIFAVSDGTNCPLTLLTAQAIPTFTTAEMYVGSGTGIKEWELDVGNQIHMSGDGGLAWHTLCVLRRQQPQIRVLKSTPGELGSAATEIGAVTLLDVPSGGIRGETPITFTFNQKQTTARRVGGDPADYELVITPTYDGTNTPIIVTGI